MKRKIYIADDDDNIRLIISSFLLSEGYHVESFSNGDALYEHFKREPADLIILDILMDGSDGLTLCSKIRQQHSVLIIIVSALDSELDRIKGITLGSDDYLVKPFSPLELVARIKALFRRYDMMTHPTEEDELNYGDMILKTKLRQCFINNIETDLTPTEFSVLHFMMLHSNQAISRKELFNEVWDVQWDHDTRAMDDMLKRLRKKLNHSQVRIETVWGYGFRLSLVGEHENT